MTTYSYIYGPDDLPIEQISSEGTVTYLHHDQQGSMRLLTGSTGTVTGSTVTGSTTFDACLITGKVVLSGGASYASQPLRRIESRRCKTRRTWRRDG